MVNSENLRKLADYLDRPEPLAKVFEMGSYCAMGGHGLPPDEHECGTTACALGCGPDAGIPISESDFFWSHYGERISGVDWLGSKWLFMFSGGWANTDNTRQGAARRIRYVAEHGKAPDGWTYETPFPEAQP